MSDTDWTKKLDLNRTTVTTNFVARMEECMRAQQTASDDLKEVVAQAAEQEFSKRDIEAMKKIARLRLKDQIGRRASKSTHFAGSAAPFRSTCSTRHDQSP